MLQKQYLLFKKMASLKEVRDLISQSKVSDKAKFNRFSEKKKCGWFNKLINNRQKQC